MLTYSLSVICKSIAEKPSQSNIIAEGYISKKMTFYFIYLFCFIRKPFRLNMYLL